MSLVYFTCCEVLFPFKARSSYWAGFLWPPGGSREAANVTWRVRQAECNMKLMRSWRPSEGSWHQAGQHDRGWKHKSVANSPSTRWTSPDEDVNITNAAVQWIFTAEKISSVVYGSWIWRDICWKQENKIWKQKNSWNVQKRLNRADMSRIRWKELKSSQKNWN